MKKFKAAVLLFLLISASLLLCSCDFANSSPEKAVETLVEGTLEFDVEKVLKAQFEFNRDIRERFDKDFDEDEFSEEYKEFKKFFEEQKAEQNENYTDVSYEYKIIRCDIYSEGDTEFEMFKASLDSEEYTEYLEAIDSIAEVRISGEMVMTDENGGTDTEDLDNTFNCVRIDRKWYVTG